MQIPHIHLIISLILCLFLFWISIILHEIEKKKQQQQQKLSYYQQHYYHSWLQSTSLTLSTPSTVVVSLLLSSLLSLLFLSSSTSFQHTASRASPLSTLLPLKCCCYSCLDCKYIRVYASAYYGLVGLLGLLGLAWLVYHKGEILGIFRFLLLSFFLCFLFFSSL